MLLDHYTVMKLFSACSVSLHLFSHQALLSQFGHSFKSTFTFPEQTTNWYQLTVTFSTDTLTAYHNIPQQTCMVAVKFMYNHYQLSVYCWWFTLQKAITSHWLKWVPHKFSLMIFWVAQTFWLYVNQKGFLQKRTWLGDFDILSNCLITKF